MRSDEKGYHIKTISQVIRESVDINYSQFIDKLVAFGEEDYGLTFDLFASELDADGRIHYNKKLIEINVSDAKRALMTIAHEIGHWVGYQENGTKPQNSFTTEQREDFARKHGWELMQQIGADKFISKDEWDKENA